MHHRDACGDDVVINTRDDEVRGLNHLVGIAGYIGRLKEDLQDCSR